MKKQQTICSECGASSGHNNRCPIEYKIAPLSEGKRWYSLHAMIRLVPVQANNMENLLRKYFKLDTGITGLDDFSLEPEMIRKDGAI